MKKLSLAVLAATTMLQMCAFGQSAPAPRKAPELAFTLPGQGEKLLSQLHGKVIALEFILTTCPHCQASSHVLSGLQQKFGNQGFQALDLAINGLDEGRGPEQASQLVAAFSQTYQAQFPVGWVQRDAMTTFMGFSFIERTVVPQVVFIDRKGMIRYQTPASGESNLRDADTMTQKVEQLLAEKESASSHHASGSRVIAKRAS